MESLGRPSEKLRQLLLEQELRLRKKQPEHWAKTKYRKYAKPFTEEELEKIRELETKRKETRKKARRGKKKKGRGKRKDLGKTGKKTRPKKEKRHNRKK